MSVYCIGDIRADITMDATGSGAPAVTTDLGGTGGNVALLLAKYGLDVKLVGTVAGDNVGRYLLNGYRSYGVDMEYVRVTENGFFNTLLTTKDGEEIGSAIWLLPGVTYDGIRDIDFSRVSPGKGDIVHTTGACMENDLQGNRMLADFLTAAKKAGAVVSFDINAREQFFGTAPDRIEVLRACAGIADIVTGSKTEFDLIGGYTGIAAPGKIALIRNQADPVLLICDGGEYSIPTYPVTVVNPMEAGDSFDAGFLYAYLGGHDLQECAGFANYCAAYAISQPKARQIPDSESIKSFFKN